MRMLRTGDFFAEGVFGEYTASCASKKGSYAPKREVFNSSIYDEYGLHSHEPGSALGVGTDLGILDEEAELPSAC